MPVANRVTPYGTLEASPARGLFTGNRGRLRRPPDQGAGWSSPAWITCTLSPAWGNPRREVRYTRLFFADEAVAFAAAHRPCSQCRRDDYLRFLSAWRACAGRAGDLAPDIDGRLRREHRARPLLTAGQIGALPFGSFVEDADDGAAYLVSDRGLRRWFHDAYGPAQAPGPERTYRLLTPVTIVDVLRAGYRPVVRGCLATADARAAT